MEEIPVQIHARLYLPSLMVRWVMPSFLGFSLLCRHSAIDNEIPLSCTRRYSTRCRLPAPWLRAPLSSTTLVFNSWANASASTFPSPTRLRPNRPLGGASKSSLPRPISNRKKKTLGSYWLTVGMVCVWVRSRARVRVCVCVWVCVRVRACVCVCVRAYIWV